MKTKHLKNVYIDFLGAFIKKEKTHVSPLPIPPPH